jgi:hypothetical protein
MTDRTTATSEWEGLPFYTRTAIVGLLVYGLILFVFGALSVSQGDTATGVFVGIFAIPSFVLVGLASGWCS